MQQRSNPQQPLGQNIFWRMNILTNDFVGVILTNKVLWTRIEKLDTLNEPLSQKMIKSFHVELKSGVFEDHANGYVFAFGMVS